VDTRQLAQHESNAENVTTTLIFPEDFFLYHYNGCAHHHHSLSVQLSNQDACLDQEVLDRCFFANPAAYYDKQQALENEVRQIFQMDWDIFGNLYSIGYAMVVTILRFALICT